MHRLRIVAISLAFALHVSDVFGQTAVQVPLQLDFVNPGAKTLALGGAFTGLADDATAGFANPAGLRELGRMEMSIEVRGRWLENSYLQRGRLSGAIFNEGNDVIAGPVFGKIRDNGIQIPYVSVVFPRPEQGWVIAGFRHELARIDQSSFSEGVFQKDPAEFTSRREFPQQLARQIAITQYGAAGAYEINPRLAVGGTLGVYTFDLLTDVRRFDTIGFLGPPNLNVERSRATQEGENIAFAPTVGVRLCLKPCEDRQEMSTRFGAVYRRGPTFDFETEEGLDQRSNKFRVPDTFAAGVAVEIPQSGKRLLFSAEVKRLTYSRIFNDFIRDQTLATGVQDKVTINDGTEFHAGVQYTLETPAWLPRFRAGVWSDPDHSVKFVPGALAVNANTRITEELLSVALSTGKRLTHFTGGVGLTFSPTIEWNFGADFASNTTIVSTSVIVKLGQ
jgi:long-chain fatty acid transport protein